MKKTLNPEFRDEFIYKLDRTALEKRTLEVTVWDEKMTRNVFIGKY